MNAHYTFLASDFSSSKDMMVTVVVIACSRGGAHKSLEQLWGAEPRFQRLVSIEQV